MGLLVVFLVAAAYWCESSGHTMSTSSSSSSSSQSVSNGADGVVYTVVQKSTSNLGDPGAVEKVTVTQSVKPVDAAALARATEKEIEDTKKKLEKEMATMERKSKELADSIDKEIQNSFKEMSSSFLPF